MPYDDIDEIGIKLSNLKAPEHWIKEGTEDPSEDACIKALELICDIYEKIEEFPEIIAATVESGVYLAYRRDPIFMYYEIYNIDLSIGCVINDNTRKKIIYCKDLENMVLEEALHIYEMETQKNI